MILTKLLVILIGGTLVGIWQHILGVEITGGLMKKTLYLVAFGLYAVAVFYAVTE